MLLVSYRAEILRVDRLNQSGRLPTAGTAKSACCSTNDASRTTTKTTQYKSIFSNVPPFIFEYEVSRGVLHALQSAMQFAFMLATMYVISYSCYFFPIWI